LKRYPKVLLHDHLDGGLRPETIIEIADEIGYQGLPAKLSSKLADWFHEAADSGTLERYLKTFSHTIAVMQREKDIVRIAKEAVLDLAADGVIYAEIRVAPEHFTKKGLTMEAVTEAMLEGYRLGEVESGLKVNTILCGMRNLDKSQEVAELVVKYRDKGVVSFDIAGPEKGFAPTLQKETFDYLRSKDIPFTIHAGEADGPNSIDQAINICGAKRIGHGVRIVEDLPNGRIAKQVLDEQIHLEVCPTSNLQTGVADIYSNHPIKELFELGYNVGINTDNRLMSHTSMSHEFEESAKAFGWGSAEFKELTLCAMNATFIDDKRAYLMQIEERYDQFQR
jgi:adenosine deaminase